MRISTRLGALAAIGLLVIVSGPGVKAAGGTKLRIIQNAMAGDAVTIIDPATNKIVGQIDGIEISNGVAVSPDGARIYATGEVEKTLFVADAKTFKVEMKVPLSGRPSALGVSKDGARIFVGIQDVPVAALKQSVSGVDVVDTVSLKVIKNLPLDGAKTHYVFMTRDGKYAMATVNGGTTPADSLTLRFIDVKTLEVAKTIVGEGTGGHRACDFVPNPDQSTKYVVCNQGQFSGFVIYDFDSGKVFKKVPNPNVKSGEIVRLRNVESAQGSPSHGIAVSPDGKVVVVSDRWYNLIHVYSAPDFTHLYSIPVAPDPFWFTFSPDGKTVYSSAAFSEMVSVVDLAQKKETTRIRVQNQPKRITTAMLQ